MLAKRDEFLDMFEKQMQIRNIGNDTELIKRALGDQPTKKLIIIVYNHVFKNS